MRVIKKVSALRLSSAGHPALSALFVQGRCLSGRYCMQAWTCSVSSVLSEVREKMAAQLVICTIGRYIVFMVGGYVWRRYFFEPLFTAKRKCFVLKQMYLRGCNILRKSAQVAVIKKNPDARPRPRLITTLSVHVN